MNINFALFKVFYAVASCGSISKGAEKLMISQPAVTQSIHTLEEQLGGRLFIRTPKGVVLTDEGKTLYSYVREGMDYFVNGTNKFLSLKNLDSGVLNIGVTTVLCENLLMDVLKTFHEKYPNVVLNIYNDLTENLVKKLRNGDLDIIIISMMEGDFKDIEYHPICKVHDVFVGTEKYKNIVLDLNNIDKMDIIMQKNPSIMRRNFEYSIKRSFSPKMEVVSHALVCKFVKAGFGIGLVTREFVSDELFEIKCKFPIHSRDVVYGIKHDRESSFSCLEFIKIIGEFYETM